MIDSRNTVIANTKANAKEEMGEADLTEKLAKFGHPSSSFTRSTYRCPPKNLSLPAQKKLSLPTHKKLSLPAPKKPIAARPKKSIQARQIKPILARPTKSILTRPKTPIRSKTYPCEAKT